jgi:3-oxoacyl-[acyl-carrier-protein] synthase II
MRLAQEDAGLTDVDAASRVDAIIAHGTGTPQGDLAEIRAINDVFAGREVSLPVTSVKGHMGHTGAAAGIMNVLAGLHAMSSGRLVHTAGTTEPEPGANFTVVLDHPVETRLDTIQVNAFGFGGQDASLVLTRD